MTSKKSKGNGNGNSNGVGLELYCCDRIRRFFAALRMTAS